MQVENRDLSTLVYLAYTTPDTENWNKVSSWMNFGDKTYIRIPSSTKKYQMLSTINMPINSEAENKYMMFTLHGVFVAPRKAMWAGMSPVRTCQRNTPSGEKA